MFVIGVDPDVVKSGFAFYHEGRLVALKNWDLKHYINALMHTLPEQGITVDNTTLVIECGLLIKGIYKEHHDKNPHVYAKKAHGVGRNNQHGECMADIAEQLGYKVIREKPQRGNWGSHPELTNQFKLATGWTKQSNPETRSAAFFGFLYKDQLFT